MTIGEFVNMFGGSFRETPIIIMVDGVRFGVERCVVDEGSDTPDEVRLIANTDFEL